MTRILLGQSPIVLLSAKAATGAGGVIDVSSYDEIVIAVYTSSSASATLKIAGSMSLAAPAFASSQSVTNVYDYIDLIPFSGSATPVVGATGIVMSGTDIIKLYTVDVKYVKWICPVVTAYSAGSINCAISGANNFAR